LSAASSSVVLARVARVFGLLTVPEELAVPRVVALRDETEARFEELLGGVTIERLLGDELARQRHFAAVQPRPAPTRGHPDVMYITARAKLADAQTAAEALSWLTTPERLAVLGDRDLFHALERLVNPEVSDQQALRSA
jgi:membrane glycosyltransferase